MADANSLDLTTGMTLEAWVQPTALGSLWRCVILKEQPSNLIYALYAGDGLGRPATDVFTTADKGFSGPTALTLNTWVHLAATYDGTTQRLFVNGVQVATKATTGAIRVSTGALRIGGNTLVDQRVVRRADRRGPRLQQGADRGGDPGRHGQAGQLTSGPGEVRAHRRGELVREG